MATLTKQALGVENQTSFPNNSTGFITPEKLRNFNTDIIDSLALQTQADSSSIAIELFSGSQYKADSSSFDLRIDNIEAWSSSLDLQYATDAQLAAVSVSLNLAKLDTSSFSTFSSSVYTSVSSSTFFSGSQYKGDSASFDSRITNIVAPVGTVSSSAQITAFGFATTSSVNAVSTSAYNATTYSVALSASVYQTDVTQSINIAAASSSAFTTYLSASAWSSSLAFTMNNNSSSTFQTDATQSNNITINSQSAWGAFQSASAYSASAAVIDNTQTTNITQASASAWGAFQSASSFSSSAATTYVKLNAGNTNQTITGSLILSSSAAVELTVVGNQIISGNLDISGALSASIPQGYAWVGGVGDRATLALTSSIQGVQFPYTGSATITGSLSVTGSYNIVSGSASGSLISNAGDTFSTTAVVTNIITLTAAEYAALASSSANTLYIII
jgi:hypothetical protein